MSEVNIRRIDIDSLHATGGRIRDYARNFSAAAKSAYQNMQNLRENWTGNNYQLMINKFRENQVVVDGAIRFGYQVAKSIETSACNYNEADNKGPLPISSEGLEDCTPSIDDNPNPQLMYNGAAVEAAKNAILGCFQECKDNLASIQQELISADWESKAGDQYIADVQELKIRVDNVIEEITTSFEANMNTATSNMMDSENLRG